MVASATIKNYTFIIGNALPVKQYQTTFFYVAAITKFDDENQRSAAFYFYVSLIVLATKFTFRTIRFVFIDELFFAATASRRSKKEKCYISV